MKIKLIPTSERSTLARCWFCRTSKSVKYTAMMVHTNPLSPHRYMHILVCNKCAALHMDDFIEQ